MRMTMRHTPGSADSPMQVKVRPLNYQGRPLFKDELKLRDAYAGTIKVMENRVHRLGRVVTTATFTGRQGDVDTVTLTLRDVNLLWMDKRKLRLRGFEDIDGVEYGQTWDIEIL
jgi:hypothetical protein